MPPGLTGLGHRQQRPFSLRSALYFWTFSLSDLRWGSQRDRPLTFGRLHHLQSPDAMRTCCLVFAFLCCPSKSRSRWRSPSRQSWQRTWPSSALEGQRRQSPYLFRSMVRRRPVVLARSRWTWQRLFPGAARSLHSEHLCSSLRVSLSGMSGKYTAKLESRGAAYISVSNPGNAARLRLS